MKKYVVNKKCADATARSDYKERWEFFAKIDGDNYILSAYIPSLMLMIPECVTVVDVETTEQTPFTESPQFKAEEERFKGFGDTVEKWIKATHLDKLSDLYTKLSGKPCKCPARKALLNKLFPYRPNKDEPLPEWAKS
jgi:hypothetical protein